MADAIVLERFSFRYREGQKPALDAVSITVPVGSICAVMGPSEAGKTTLLYALAGVLGSRFATGSADGVIIIDGERYHGAPQKILFPRTSLVLHEARLQITGFRSTVRDEISFTLENLHLPESDRIERIRDVSNALKIDHLLERNPDELSGGELHRVAIATMLVARPPVLLLDEPGRSLDSASLIHLARTLQQFKQSGTIIFTDCELELPLQLADQYVVLDRGQLMFKGNRRQFIESFDRFGGLLPVADWLAIQRHLERNPTISQSLDPRIRRLIP